VLGELASLDVGGDVLQSVRQVLFKLPENDASVRVLHGLAQPDASTEAEYLIDSDFFSEKATEPKNAARVLDYFNRQARNLFRWFIKDRLHAAMEPRRT
jgi:uncharacterized protein (TIGR04255 family)